MQPFSPHIWHSFFLALPQPQFGFFFFFFVNSSDLLYMVHSTCLWTPSIHPNPVLLSHPYLPPNIKPTPAQPHRLFKKDLGNRTELYFREINLTTMCRAGWRQQASWEPSTECENLNMELTGNGKWIKMKWKTQALVFVLGCQGNHLISLKSWFEGVRRKKLSKVEAVGIGLLLTNFGEKNYSEMQKLG